MSLKELVELCEDAEPSNQNFETLISFLNRLRDLSLKHVVDHEDVLEKKLLICLISEAVKSFQTAEVFKNFLSTRLDTFGTEDFAEVEAVQLQELLKRASTFEKDVSYAKLRLAIFAQSIISPYRTLIFLVGYAYSFHASTGLIIHLLSDDLRVLCLHTASPGLQPLLSYVIHERIERSWESNAVSSTVRVFKELAKSKYKRFGEPVITFENLMSLFCRHTHPKAIKKSSIPNQIQVMKQLLICNVAGRQTWEKINAVQMVDYFLLCIESAWSDGLRKQEVVSILQQILNKHLRPLTEEEQVFVCERLMEEKYEPVLLAYVAQCFGQKMKDILDLDHCLDSEHLLLAAINEEIANEHRYCPDPTSLQMIVCFLTWTEFQSLFNFMNRHYSTNAVIVWFAESFVKVEENRVIARPNWLYMFHCFHDLVMEKKLSGGDESKVFGHIEAKVMLSIASILNMEAAKDEESPEFRLIIRLVKKIFESYPGKSEKIREHLNCWPKATLKIHPKAKSVLGIEEEDSV